MIKNAIIVIQSLVLLFVLVWYMSYKHEILQTFHVASLGFMASETRLLGRLNERLERGEIDETRRILSQIISSNTADMENAVKAIDLTRPERLDDAIEYAAIVESAGITKISELVKRRAAEQSGPN